MVGRSSRSGLDADRIPVQSRRLRALCTVTLVVIVAAITASFVLASADSDFRAGTPFAGGRLSTLVQTVPTVFYLWALWSIRRTFADLAAGGRLAPAVGGALRHVGLALMAGSLASLFLVTNVLRLLGQAGGGYAHFDTSALVIAVVGAALLLLSNVLERAAIDRAELDEFL